MDSCLTRVFYSCEYYPITSLESSMRHCSIHPSLCTRFKCRSRFEAFLNVMPYPATTQAKGRADECSLLVSTNFLSELVRLATPDDSRAHNAQSLIPAMKKEQSMRALTALMGWNECVSCMKTPKMRKSRIGSGDAVPSQSIPKCESLGLPRCTTALSGGAW